MMNMETVSNVYRCGILNDFGGEKGASVSKSAGCDDFWQGSVEGN